MTAPEQEITVSLRWDGSLLSAQSIVTLLNSLFPDEENPAAHNMRYGKPAIVINAGNETTELTTENKVVITKNSRTSTTVFITENSPVTITSYDKREH